MESEKRLPVVGFEGLYEVSDHGRVRSLDKVVPTRGGGRRVVRGRIRKHQMTPPGYPFVVLTPRYPKPGKVQETWLVHRLVAKAFLPPCLGKEHVNHKDSNRRNCALANLEWVTPQENTLHAVAAGRWDNANKLTKLPPAKLEMAKKMLMAHSHTRGEVVTFLGVSRSTVYSLLRSLG